MDVELSSCLNYYLCTTAGVQRLVGRGWVRPANDVVIYKTELRLVLSSARSLFCLNIRSFGNVVAAGSAATPVLASRQNLIFLRQLIFCRDLQSMTPNLKSVCLKIFYQETEFRTNRIKLSWWNITWIQSNSLMTHNLIKHGCYTGHRKTRRS